MLKKFEPDPRSQFARLHVAVEPSELSIWEAKKRAHDYERIREMREEQQLKILRRELGPSFDDRTFEKFNEKPGNELALARAREIVLSGFTVGGAFYGGEGCGKTHLAAAVLYAAIRDGKRARFATMQRFCDELIAGEKNGTKLEVLYGYLAADIVVLDDVGKEFQGSWTAAVRFDGVNALAENGKPLVITSNMSDEALVEFYDTPRSGIDSTSGASLVGRLVRLCGGSNGWCEITALSERWK
jgi:DNA replication protein DnaC